MNALPIIDIAPLYADDALAWPAVAEQIDRACRDWGFFYIVGHPIGSERIDALLNAAKRFFALPADDKLKIDITQTAHHRGYGAIATEQLDPSKPSDLKETFDMGFHMPADHPEVLAGKPLRGPNRHPDLPGWAELTEQHYAAMQDLAKTLLRAMAMALDIEHDFFDARFHEPISVLRMIHYPPRHTATSADQQGAGAHTDYGCITLLYQDDAGGLQVRARWRVDRRAADCRQLRGQYRRHDGALEQRPVHLDATSSDQSAGGGSLLDAVLRRTASRHADRLPAELLQRGQPGQVHTGDQRRVPAVEVRRYLCLSARGSVGLMMAPTLWRGRPARDALRPSDAERLQGHSHAERGNDQSTLRSWLASCSTILSQQLNFAATQA